MYTAQRCLQVGVSLGVIEWNKGILNINITKIKNGAATCTVDQMSPNKNLC